MQGDKGCLHAPNSISFHFLSVVSNMSAPRCPLSSVCGTRSGGHCVLAWLVVVDTVISVCSVLRGKPIRGPTTLEAEVEMSELENHYVLGRYITKVMLFFSAFDF